MSINLSQVESGHRFSRTREMIKIGTMFLEWDLDLILYDDMLNANSRKSYHCRKERQYKL